MLRFLYAAFFVILNIVTGTSDSIVIVLSISLQNSIFCPIIILISNVIYICMSKKIYIQSTLPRVLVYDRIKKVTDWKKTAVLYISNFNPNQEFLLQTKINWYCLKFLLITYFYGIFYVTAKIILFLVDKNTFLPSII